MLGVELRRVISSNHGYRLVMLRDFLLANRRDIIDRVRNNGTAHTLRPDEPNTGAGIAELLDQLSLASAVGPVTAEVGHQGRARPVDLSIAQVVHGYTDIWQAVVELGAERGLQLAGDEVRAFNRGLDESIANAVAEHARQAEERNLRKGTERLAVLAHELRDAINTAMLAFDLLKRGVVEPTSNTAGVLDRSFGRMRDLVDRSLAQVRLEAGMVHPARIRVAVMIEEAELAGSLEAHNRDIAFSVATGPHEAEVEADRQLLTGAIANLLQNAFKFTPRRGHVSLTARAEAQRVLIEVQDECGGLPPVPPESLFQRFEQRGADRSGIGMGLAITRASVRAMGGEVSARDLPGKGCVFTIDLPAYDRG